jgi:hypothetical protein
MEGSPNFESSDLVMINFGFLFYFIVLLTNGQAGQADTSEIKLLAEEVEG